MSAHVDTESRWTGLSEVTRMAGPIMLGAVSIAGMDFVDKMFVSWIGTDHLAAVGNGGLWMYTCSLFFLGIAGCVSTFVAQSYGKNRYDDCARFAWQGVYIALAGGALALLLWPFAPMLFGSMNHSPEVTRLETLYFQLRLFGIAFMGWEVAITCFFQATSRPVIPMAVGVFANLLNIGLDYVLIFGKFGLPAMGITGAAMATVIAIAVQAIILQSIFLSRGVNQKYGTRRTFAPQLRKCRDLLHIGWPAGVANFLDVFGWSIFTGFIVGSFGTVSLAAQTAAMNFMHFSFLPAVALGQASTALVGQWIGRNDIATAKARAYTAVRLGITVMLITGVSFAVFGSTLMRIFSSDTDVIAIGHQLLILAAIFAAFDAVGIVLIGALRGAGDTRWIMVVMTIGAYGVNLPLAWFFAIRMNLGAKGAWIGATIYVIILSGVVLHRFRSEAWRHIRIFSAEQPVAAEVPDEGLGVESAK